MTEIEIHGLELFGHHGVNEDERERGQMFVYDIWLTVDEPEDDDIAATVDYREVRKIVEDVGALQQFQLLESLAAAIADGIVAQLPVPRVRVRVRKPEVQWALHTAVTVERP